MQIIDESDITSSALVTTLISAGETRTREYKRVSGKMVGKALETVCGFANADGGVLVLGVADLKEHQGKLASSAPKKAPRPLTNCCASC